MTDLRQETLTKERVFPLDELDGFYIDDGICVHITFEDEHTVAIDLFNHETAAYDPERGNLVRAIILSLKTGRTTFEGEG